MQLEIRVYLNLIMVNFNKAIFLDRDGVINKDRSDYVKSIHELEIFSNIEKDIKKIKEKGFLVIVVSNQSAIGRNLTSHTEVQKIHDHIQQYLKKWNVQIDAFYYCPHHPNDNCNCRKPKPGLILQAANDHNIDLSNSWVIGDHDRDFQSGLNAGCKSIKISEQNTLSKVLDHILENL